MAQTYLDGGSGASGGGGSENEDSREFHCIWEDIVVVEDVRKNWMCYVFSISRL